MAFYCNGKNGVCDRHPVCKSNCEYFDGSGGKHINTNADRIRAMSDEELAVFLADKIDHGDCYDCRLECATYEGDKFEDSCHNAYYRWLKQPAEE